MNKLITFTLTLGVVASLSVNAQNDTPSADALLSQGFTFWDQMEANNWSVEMDMIHSASYTDAMVLHEPVQCLIAGDYMEYRSELVTMHSDKRDFFLCLHEEQQIIQLDMTRAPKEATETMSASQVRKLALKEFVLASDQRSVLDSLDCLSVVLVPKNNSPFAQNTDKLTLLFSRQDHQFVGYHVEHRNRQELVSELRRWTRVAIADKATTPKRASAVVRTAMKSGEYKNYQILQP